MHRLAAINAYVELLTENSERRIVKLELELDYRCSAALALGKRLANYTSSNMYIPDRDI
jgi:hypothetical protein